MKTYDECYEVIALHHNDVLPLFADAWNRFPDPKTASIIVEKLKGAVFTYRMLGEKNPKNENTAKEIIDVIETIKARA